MSKRKPSKQEKALRRYFARNKKGAVIGFFLFVTGVAVLYFASHADYVTGWEWPSGLLILVAGAALIWNAATIPNDQRVDKWLDEGIDKLIKSSRTKLNLGQLTASGKQGPAAEPLVVLGPILWETHGVAKEDLVWRKGKDKVVRYGVFRISILHLAEEHLAAYSCDYDFLRDAALNEETEEYHYVDVVGVTTRELSSLTLPSGEKLTSVQQFTISVTSGQVIDVIVNAEKLSKETGSDKMPETGAEKAVSVIRAMLRDKKRVLYPGAVQASPSVTSLPRGVNQPPSSADVPHSSMHPPAQTAIMCSKCGSPATATDKFCMACGKEISVKPRTCKRCGVELTPGAKYCAGCGNKVR
jgi:hypothetical protein